MSSVKQIILLLGQKGSSKTFIGSLIERNFGIKFLRVEDMAKQIINDRSVNDETYLAQVFAVIEAGVRDSLRLYEKIVFESTGTTVFFDKMLENLKKDFDVTTIYIKAGGDLCLDRVKSRDQNLHINISDDQVAMINRKVLERNLQTDYVIENENRSEEELVDEIREMLKKMKSWLGANRVSILNSGKL